MRSFYIETGVEVRAREISQGYIDKAKDSLTIFEGDHKITMDQFTDFVLNRTH